MSKSLSLWSTLILTNIIAAFWLYYFGTFGFIFSADMTYLSWFIIMVYTGILLLIPKELRADKPFDRKFALHMTITNRMTDIGLFGTIIGLIFLAYAFATADITVGDQSSVIDMIQIIFRGMGTALVTTAVGLAAELLLFAQLIAIDKVHKNEAG